MEIKFMLKNCAIYDAFFWIFSSNFVFKYFPQKYILYLKNNDYSVVYTHLLWVVSTLLAL